jgi:glycosyltransferase involved in cell wall biosynthesis
MAARVLRLIEDEGLRMRIGTRAAEDARRGFDMERMAEEYLGWYEEILNSAPSQI